MSDSNSNTPQTPEAVAFQLMERILQLEGKYTEKSNKHDSSDKKLYASRQEILNTYKECLTLVRSTG